MPNRLPLRTFTCPRCGRTFQYTSLAEHKPFPFCSPRCRDVDLGNWLTEKYVVPGEPLVAKEDEEQEDGPTRPGKAQAAEEGEARGT